MVVGVSCAILVLLFMSQSYGTSKIAFIFAPIVVLFLLVTAVVGVWNLARYNAWWVLKVSHPPFPSPRSPSIC